MKKRDEYKYWLYQNRYQKTESLLQYIVKLVQDNNIRINVLLVATSSNLIDILKKYKPENYSIKIVNDEPVFTLSITKRLEDHEQTVAAVIAKYDEKLPVYLILSDCKTNDFKEIITKCINKYFPEISYFFLTNTEIRTIIEKIEAESMSSIIVKNSVCKKRLPGLNDKESQVTYTNKHFQEIFDSVYENDQWISSIRYRAEQRDMTADGTEVNKIIFSGYISKNCFIYMRQDFRPVLNTIIPLSIQFGSVRNEYLETVAKSAIEPVPKPISIRFEENFFKDKDRNKQFLLAMEELESCSFSEYHTNPYIHISLLDYLDGSSYDIWVVSDNRMYIIPQLSASAASLSRIVNHVFERLQEGTIEPYEQGLTV